MTATLAARRWYVIPDPSVAPRTYTISGLCAELRGGHEHVRVWSRGGLAGELVLEAGDTARLAAACGLAAADPD
jgi:hypothetical protein